MEHNPSLMELFQEIGHLDLDSPEAQQKLREFVARHPPSETPEVIEPVEFPNIEPYVFDIHSLAKKAFAYATDLELAAYAANPELIVDVASKIIVDDAKTRYRECPDHPGFFQQIELANRTRDLILRQLVRQSLSGCETPV
jgi:hypothetical protein